ncbi:MAG TPA: formyltransferase family protein [Acidobacteriota bacterium]|nr:formyltransferase family protein [Acidobacteriota bacterium]
MARLVLFVNGELGIRAVEFLAGQVVGAVVHPPGERDSERIRNAVGDDIPIWKSDQLEKEQTRSEMEGLRPTHGLSVLYGDSIPASILDLFPEGAANLHPSLLPHGRGAHPHAWAIAAKEPAGVTLHLIDGGLNTGPILAQEAVHTLGTDTAAALYARLIDTATQLLASSIPLWLQGRLQARPQPKSPSAPRQAGDLDRELRIDPDKSYSGRELIDILRARTFPPYPGAPYDQDGARLRVRIELAEEDD